MPRKITQKTRRVAVVRCKNGKTPTSTPKTAKNAQKKRNTAKSKKTVPIEDDECIVFSRWLKLRGIPHAHIANESRSSTKNAAIRGAKLKKMGQSKGVWDYEVYIPQIGITGEIDDYQLLKIEMKRQRGGGSTVSPEQRKWGKIYETAGIPHKVCYGADEAIAFVIEYYHEDDEVF